MVDVLLKAGVGTGVRTNDIREHYTPVMEAARHGHVDVVRLLLQNNANVNATSGHRDVVRLLLQGKVNVTGMREVSAVDLAERHGFFASSWREVFCFMPMKKLSVVGLLEEYGGTKAGNSLCCGGCCSWCPKKFNRRERAKHCRGTCIAFVLQLMALLITPAPYRITTPICVYVVLLIWSLWYDDDIRPCRQWLRERGRKRRDA